DQVMVIPLTMFGAFLGVKNADAAAMMARAYNDWVHDWCSPDPSRPFAAAVLPLQAPDLAAEELRRVTKKGFRVAMVRPIEIQGYYPNHPHYAPMWDAFEETGLVVAMHTLASRPQPENEPSVGLIQPGTGLFLERAISSKQIAVPSQTLGFVHESMTWLANVLLSGFFEDRPGIKRMAIMESNATWLPSFLQDCDRAFHLYRVQRKRRVTRLPSEIFLERCFIAFESDESPVYRQLKVLENVGIWSSDVYHHDGTDAWTALREMRENRVGEPAQTKLMGGNARRMYGIEGPSHFTRNEPVSYERPDWYPRVRDVESEFAPLMKD
ncbi:MAG: amidohydrolase family protein, partial [Chloroflexi bacterium]|nr:amidohydrolase family protein [Chloroflexota bacterium]